MSCWAIVAGALSSTGGLLLFPYICSKDRRCFLDCACIDQTDQARMQAGIRNIGGFLQAAEELHVLWSEPYLTRLWLGFWSSTIQGCYPPPFSMLWSPSFLWMVLSCWWFCNPPPCDSPPKLQPRRRPSAFTCSSIMGFRSRTLYTLSGFWSINPRIPTMKQGICYVEGG